MAVYKSPKRSKAVANFAIALVPEFCAVVSADFAGDTPPTFETAAHNQPSVPVTVVSAADAYARVLAQAGTCLNRDAVELRLIGQLSSLGTKGTVIDMAADGWWSGDLDVRRPIRDVELAMQAARSGRAQEAIEIMANEAAQESSGRGRFRRRVQLAQICLGAGRAELAAPILQDLSGEIERRNLEAWEQADMLSHPLALLLRCLAKLDASAEERQKLYARICRLDPLQALSIKK